MTTLGDMGELGLIRRLVDQLGPAGPDLVIGPGEDDTAAWQEGEDRFTVASCDTMVESVHFDFRWLTPGEVGWRAVALALGDLAAKGAVPTYGLASLSAPAAWPSAFALELNEGMAAMAVEAGLQFVGGDTTASPGPVVVAVTVLGRTGHRPLARSAAKPGWRVAVTGRLGAASAALAAAKAGRLLEPDWEAALRRPRPRLAEGLELAAAGLVCGDISDGLYQELEKFEAAAGVGADLRLSAVPLASGVGAREALGSGEEVELVCVGPPAAVEAAAGLACGLAVVGELTAEPGIRVQGPDGARLEVTDLGYRHF